ncbi:hypothetical protein BLNAU_15603 [Blattamonas nauphoetae]|uniref:Uncharacterized protein n=1 Tax=Blattamonas nauphoetae TaxID=2049346 RepID=A0ABQ9XAB5_9EUKA|nr:hypothetical protein BLNAU_15603 [Blattamonas nauphoetae]
MVAGRLIRRSPQHIVQAGSHTLEPTEQVSASPTAEAGFPAPELGKDRRYPQIGGRTRHFGERGKNMASGR